MEHFRAACSSCSSSGEHVQTYQRAAKLSVFYFGNTASLFTEHLKKLTFAPEFPSIKRATADSDHEPARSVGSAFHKLTETQGKATSGFQTANTLQKDPRGKTGICVANKLNKKQK